MSSAEPIEALCAGRASSRRSVQGAPLPGRGEGPPLAGCAAPALANPCGAQGSTLPGAAAIARSAVCGV
eukprot:9031833-Lingulodinium_polyedra.AAC.1